MPKLNTVAKAAPKLAGGKAPAKAAAPKLANAKPGKAVATTADKRKPPVAYRVGQHVEFVGYTNKQDNPIFKAGDALVVVEKAKDADKNTVYSVVKADDHAQYLKDADSVNGEQVFGTEIKATEVAVVDPYAIQVPHTDGLDEVLKEHKGNALKAALDLQNDIAENMFYFGGCVAELYKGQAFRKHGDYADEVVEGNAKKGSGWDKFCQEQFNMGGRKAEGLMTVYRTYAALPGIDLTKLASNKKIGWVKLEYAAKVVNEGNVKEVLKQAEDQNVYEFRETIRTEYVSADASTRNAGGAKIKRVTVTLRFFEDQATGVQQVLTAAEKQFGYSNMEQVVERIVMEWAQSGLSEAAFKKARTAKRSVIRQLKSEGVDVESRQAADAELETVLNAVEKAEAA